MTAVLGRFSLVKTQEAVMLPMKIDELVTEDVTKEVSKESLTQVELDKAAAELPKPSLVSIQEQARFTHLISSHLISSRLISSDLIKSLCDQKG